MRLFGIFTVLATLIGFVVPANGGLPTKCCACRPNAVDPVSECTIVENEDEARMECENENAKLICIDGEFTGSLEECVEMLSENPLITCAGSSDPVAAPAVSTSIAFTMAAALAGLGIAVTRRRHSA